MKTETLPNADDFMAQIVAMDGDKQKAFKILVVAILKVMSSDEGCAVLALDVEGNGQVLMSVLGDPLIAPHLSRAMADVMTQLDETVGGMQ